METTVGQVIINDMLPEDMRDYNRVWDKKTKGKVLTDLARRHPDQFKEVSHNLLRFGARAAYETGGQSFGIEDIAPTQVSRDFQKEMGRRMQQIMRNAYRRGKTSADPEVQQEIADAAIPWMSRIDEGIKQELGDKNPFYRQAFGTGAQKPGTLRSIVGADVFYVDQNNKRVPIPVTHGYAQGLTPAEYFIQSFGTRKGMVDLQKATQDAGFLCISEKTKVRMADFSVKAIEDIKVGDWVLGIDNEDSRIGIPVRVTAVFNNGLRECYKTTFRLGAEKHSKISLVSTKEHKLLCETQKTDAVYKRKEDGSKYRTHETTYSAEVIPVGSEKKWSALPLNDVYKFDGKNEPMALLLGLLIGDDSITNTKNNRDIELTCFDPLLVDYLTESTYLSSLDLKISIHNKEKGHYVIRDKERQTQNIKVNKNKFASALNSNLKIRLNELGLLGTNSKTKFIPDEVYTWDKQSIANLIGGYFVTDGSIHLNSADRQQPMITFGSVSKRLLEQVKELLESRFGILCHSVYTSDRNHRLNPTNAVAYSLAISRRQDVQQFCKEIPVIGIKKQKIEELKDKFSDKGRDKRRYYKVAQEFVGDLQTYDIEVDSPNHLFVLANGLIVSNSKQLVQIAHRLVVTDKEDPDPASFDPNMPIGYPVDTDDPDNEGAFLATDVGGYKRNTLLTPKILGDLKSKGIDNILIRSVMVGGPANGGVYAYDCGVREKGRLPSQGDFVGINAVQSISEPLTQGAISCLDPETEVRMGNATVKKLKDIKVGDTVLGASKEGKAFPVKVTNIFNNGIQPVYCTTFRQKEYPWKKVTIKATMEHKILQVKDIENPESKQVISPIGIGAKNPAAIIHQFGGANLKYARYESHFVGDIETLDIEVDCEDHLFVLANGLIVSNSKHSGGVAGADSGKAISGFKYINQLIQVPKHFQGGATHAETDGVVGKIEDAPQGGKYIYINGIQHYVGRTQDGDVPITVKKGDRVEAGDVLTEGIPNPAMIVKYKGIGEGRRYFTNMFRNALSNAGTPVHRRNIEALSRGLINYVRLNEEVGDYAPDDVLPYSMIEKDYKPREGAVTGTPSSLEECYLERPVLHYSIGTQLRPSVIKELQKYGIKQVIAHKDPPPFESEMIRGMAHVSYDPDWATRLLGAYNKESLLEGARRGATSSAESTSYVPAITFGEGDFGHIGPLKQASVLDNFLEEI